MSFARLQKKIDALGNPTVVGLDPDLAHIPPPILEKYIAQHGETLEAAALAVLEFNLNLINALCDIVPAVKAQSAFYEQLGVAGVSTLKLTCEYAKTKGMYAIIDAKRGDIGSTAAAYSAAYLGAVKVGSTEFQPFNADALTVNAYLGSDGIKPFIETAVQFDKAIFALVKTSNPSAGELQDRVLEQGDGTRPLPVLEQGKQGDSPRVQSNDSTEHGDSPRAHSPRPRAHRELPLYTVVGDMLEQISLDTADEYGYTRVGAVVGATYPEEMKLLRERLKHTFFLVPGYGAQGGTAQDAVLAFDENGRGAIVNSSRGIIAAWKKSGTTHYADAAREEAVRMRDELCRELKKK